MPSKSGGGGADELRDLDRVLEQAAAVGVVVELGGGRLAVGAAGRRGRAEQRGDQLRTRCGSWTEAIRPSRSSHSSAIGRAGPSSRSSHGTACGRRAAERLDRQLAAVAGVLGARGR